MWKMVLAVAMVVGATTRAALARESAAPVAYVVVDADSGTVLAEHDAHKRWPPASMAKMMTVLIAMERVRDGSLALDTPVRASAWASRIGGSQVYLAEGETFPLGELLKAVMIASANDGAVAVAEHIAGSTTAFVELMNPRAEAARLLNESFATYRVVAPARRGAPVGQVPIAGGSEGSVRAMALGDLRVLVKRGEDRGVVVEAHIPRLVQAPIRLRQPLGDVVVRRGDQELGRV